MSLRAILFLALFLSTPTVALAADQRLSDLVLQVRRLQQEVQRLNGRIELMQHEVSTLQRQQQEQYLDLDARLQGQPVVGARVPQLPDRDPMDPIDTVGLPPSPPETVAPPPLGEQQTYRNAFDLLKQRRYEDAARGFDDLLARYPNGEFADNARYWLGEINYVKRDYGAALIQFQRVAADYPQSPKVPSSLLKIGYIHYEQSDWESARETLRDILDKFPDTTEARLAESRLERMTREGR